MSIRRCGYVSVRFIISTRLGCSRSTFADTSLTEQIMALTGTDEFNVALEVQQSAYCCLLPELVAY